MTSQSSLVEQLRNAAFAEIFKVFGFSSRNYIRNVLIPLFWVPVHRFAVLAERFDNMVEESGIREAMRQIVLNFVPDIQVEGSQTIPEEGPLLVVSNHPGTYDSLAIIASLPRHDIRIIASGLIQFLRNLPATSRHMIFTTLDTHARMMVIRRMIRQLQGGQSVLIYPSGKLDPDPAFLPGAEEALNRWSSSVELILRKVPQTRVLVTMVSNVLSPSSWKNPLLRIWRDAQQRLQAAEIFQILQQMLFAKKSDLVPKISFSHPISVEQLRDMAGGDNLMPVLIQEARKLLPQHA